MPIIIWTVSKLPLNWEAEALVSLQAIQKVKRADSAASPMGLDSLRVVVSNPTDLVDMFRDGQ